MKKQIATPGRPKLQPTTHQRVRVETLDIYKELSNRVGLGLTTMIDMAMRWAIPKFEAASKIAEDGSSLDT